MSEDEKTHILNKFLYSDYYESHFIEIKHGKCPSNLVYKRFVEWNNRYKNIKPVSKDDVIDFFSLRYGTPVDGFFIGIHKAHEGVMIINEDD
jgi:DNA/RNA-binding domain of Phe-tRNA-synthetase-like protein